MAKRKAPAPASNPNHDFCDFLTELADFEKNVSRNIHKYNVYRKAASVLAQQPSRIHSGAEAKKLAGIGDKIAEKIDEYLQTGKLQKLDTIHNDDKSTALGLLTRVSGIGPAKALDLFADGISTLEQLKAHSHKLTHHQQIGLKYFQDFETKIPRLEIEAIETMIKTNLHSFDPLIEVTICGSYRRGRPVSGDIDCLITHPEYTTRDKTNKNILARVVDSLKSSGLITETLSQGSKKFMGACKQGELTRRLDIRLTPHNQYYCAVLYFTGSDIFNKEMRTRALEKGFTLNEYCVRPVGCTGVPGEPVEVCSERDIFDVIDYPYKEPHERDL